MVELSGSELDKLKKSYLIGRKRLEAKYKKGGYPSGTTFESMPNSEVRKLNEKPSSGPNYLGYAVACAKRALEGKPLSSDIKAKDLWAHLEHLETFPDNIVVGGKSFVPAKYFPQDVQKSVKLHGLPGVSSSDLKAEAKTLREAIISGLILKESLSDTQKLQEKIDTDKFRDPYYAMSDSIHRFSDAAKKDKELSSKASQLLKILSDVYKSLDKNYNWD